MKAELSQMQCFLNVVDAKCLEGNNMMRNLASDIRDVAYRVEEVIDNARFICRRKSSLSKYTHIIGDSIDLREVGKKIEVIRKDINEIFERYQRYNTVNSNSLMEAQPIFREDDDFYAQRLVSPVVDQGMDIVGFDHEIEQIKNYLLDQNSMNLTVISIVGQAGAGKSTLAKLAYRSVIAEGYFHNYGWISISPKYSVVELLRELVRQIRGIGNESEKKTLFLNIYSETELLVVLFEILNEERYLVVLDDIWTTDTWDKIKSVFPNNVNGSRIILTTRDMEVGKHPKSNLRIHTPDLLDEDKSWELFQKKAFTVDTQVNSITELEVVGKKLAKKCNGLPLALVVLGCFLSRNHNIHTWEQMAASVDWEIMKKEGDVGRILALSYHNMPNNLKVCFLYTASFPEDYPITVHALKKMWIAEGFVPNIRGYTQEEVAYRYVEELARRCMIQIEGRSKNIGWIQTVKVHDVLREWGIGQARKEGFLKVCTCDTDVETSYADEQRCYRVAFHGYFADELGNSLCNLRSLLAFNPDGKGLFSFKGLHLLRVLHFCSSLQECTLPEDINKLVHLRYLGLEGTTVFMFPSYMKGLRNLQILEASKATVKSLPSSLWSIPVLKHVHVYRVLHWKAMEIRTKLSLQTLYVFSVMQCDTPTWKRTIRSLQKMSQQVSWCLGIASTKHVKGKETQENKYTWDIRVDALESEVVGLELCGCFKRLHVLNDVLPHQNLFPDFLLQLKISCPNVLNDDPMPILERLPRLEVLEIVNSSYTGKSITCSSEGFLALRSLILEDLDLEEWNLQQGSMALLAILTLNKCTKLRSISNVLDRLDDLVELRLICMPQLSADDHEASRERRCRVVISVDEEQTSSN
ncbi:probable disease resistance protein At1g58602 isoform X2 [Oryza brachyantha]|nr:probable disease resistance protein At1g58602 isoform X2 [Oryza brachyantha]XP_015697445.1 probable disease resistance protein At1g58602 isoform X2 [Oryza brachyantha]